MQEPKPTEELKITPEPIGKAEFIFDVIQAVAVMFGLALLWLLEVIRNIFFRVLDRLNIKSDPRRASAFPPGRPKKRATSRKPTI